MDIERKSVFSKSLTFPESLSSREIEEKLSHDYELRPGKPKKYRGKHRSQVKGVGMMAFLRDRWMKRYRRIG